MGKPSASPRSFWLTLLAFTIIVNLTMMRLTYLHLIEIKADLIRSAWGGMLVVFLGIAVVCVWLMIRIMGNKSRFVEHIEQAALDNLLLRVLGTVIFMGVVYIIPYVKFAYKIGQDV